MMQVKVVAIVLLFLHSLVSCEDDGQAPGFDDIGFDKGTRISIATETAPTSSSSVILGQILHYLGQQSTSINDNKKILTKLVSVTSNQEQRLQYLEENKPGDGDSHNGGNPDNSGNTDEVDKDLDLHGDHKNDGVLGDFVLDQELDHTTGDQFRPFIVGGETAGLNDNPWQIALFDRGNFKCGGSLIASQWVLTAAHCLFDVFKHGQFMIDKSRLSVMVNSNELSAGEYIRVANFAVQGNYRGQSTAWRHDLAMLLLERPVQGSTIRFATAEETDTVIRNGGPCRVSGFGSLRMNFPPSNRLLQTDLPVVSNWVCQNVMAKFGAYVYPEQICAGDIYGEKGVCRGDSGGPLVCQNSYGEWKLYGVTSSGFGCALTNAYNFFTRVEKYTEPIQTLIDFVACRRDKNCDNCRYRRKCNIQECLVYHSARKCQ